MSIAVGSTIAHFLLPLSRTLNARRAAEVDWQHALSEPRCVVTLWRTFGVESSVCTFFSSCLLLLRFSTKQAPPKCLII